jgi:hypothetical protein
VRGYDLAHGPSPIRPPGHHVRSLTPRSHRRD